MYDYALVCFDDYNAEISQLSTESVYRIVLRLHRRNRQVLSSVDRGGQTIRPKREEHDARVSYHAQVKTKRTKRKRLSYPRWERESAMHTEEMYTCIASSEQSHSPIYSHGHHSIYP